MAEEPGNQAAGDHHFACTLSSVLVRRIRRTLGEDGLTQLLELSGSERTVAYLDDLTNWISYDEAMALFAAAKELTGDDQIARRVGEETIAQHAGTPVATLMRSLGSPEAIYEQISQAGSKFTTASVLDALEVAPGKAVIRERAVEGFRRDIDHCEWAKGLLSQPTMLFGLPPAKVEERTCQARGGDACVYEITWDAGMAEKTADPVEHITVLEAQLSAMTERLDSVYATATDLIADSDLDLVLARITERAATAVRAPRYLLALRGDDEDFGMRCHHSGFDEAEATRLAERVLETPADEFPDTWLVADVNSHRRSYGRLVAMGDVSFFPQERYLLELYARYAATALDGATALAEANRGHDEARALVELARSLAVASTSEEVAVRLVDSVPEVVDCDRVSVWVWDEEVRELTCRASSGAFNPGADMHIRPEDSPTLAETLESPEAEPVFLSPESDDELVSTMLERMGAVAALSTPIVARGEFLGNLTVSVMSDAERLRPRRDLLDRLSGVVSQAAIALQTARLVDKVTYQARHDALTGLANRAVFKEQMEIALAAADVTGEIVGLFFVDLDNFKSVNDDWGHHAGDELLCQVARRLLGTVRTDDTVARLGGDEFAVVLAGAEDIAAVDAAEERVLRAFEQPFVIAREPLSLGASVGRALWPDDAGEIESLMRHADGEMYRAKRAARAV
jgi:diguanylate cyclase (GGDEF)-like protein